MKMRRLKCVGSGIWLLLLSGANVFSQGFLQVDQASGTTDELLQNFSQFPLGQIAQSFTPVLPAVGFVQFQNYTLQDNNGAGVLFAVNLRESAYNGPILSSTAPVLIFGAPPKIGTFYYPDNIPVTPGQLYFLEPVLLSTGSLDIGYKNPSGYLRGDAWNNGLQDTGDYWFREGVVVPEPGTVCFLLLGGGVFIWRRATSISARAHPARSARFPRTVPRW